MNSSLDSEPVNGWIVLVRAHDHLWRDRHWPIDVRTKACAMLWVTAINLSLPERKAG